ncbi:hypothetical protein PR048_033212, partial [Dryococelus australis]
MQLPCLNTSTARCNVTHLPGLKAVRKIAKTVLDCWKKLVLPDTAINGMISALVVLVYLVGVKKALHVNVQELVELMIRLRQSHHKNFLMILSVTVKLSILVGKYTTADEMLEKFRGWCKFLQYIPNKPAKYGIKFKIYAGRQPEDPIKVDNDSSVVMHLLPPILYTGRHNTMDNYLTSVPVAKIFWNRGQQWFGTMRENNKNCIS